MSDILDARDQLDHARARVSSLAAMIDQCSMLDSKALAGLADILSETAAELDVIAATLTRVSAPSETE
ncbi:hypothetical protein [Thiocapsa rosea]|uniref:Uncharacterized protein n=1 Tax=Thiocapsa rosea TaxID=69360 RepID=A0A495VBM5_9GAMM|nr:hypothetical protein [Thiocapsa rosea]RKT46801.1 hypothetical protein BDD21_4338 [Thiocapsa rosea]